MCQIKACIGNYAAYNAGYLIDEWVELPMSQDRLNAFLERLQRKAQHVSHEIAEEFYISDYDGIPFGLDYGNVFSEYTPIDTLNLLAHLMESYPHECEIVENAINTGCDCPESITSLMNWILQADDIPFYTYNAPSWCDDAETKMGYTCLEGCDWYQVLVDACEEHHFDVQSYGRECAQYAHLGDEGYIDATQDMPREDMYDLYDIKSMLGLD